MARTIIVDEIKKDETATAMSVDGIAKSWCNLNGTGTIAIRDSLNVSSLTDRGTGKYTVTFTNAMNAADYCASQTGAKSSGDDGYVLGGIAPSGLAVSNIQVTTMEGSGGPDDLPTVGVSTLGDLA